AGSVTGPGEDETFRARKSAAAPYRERLQKIYAQRRRRYQAWHEQDMDLMVLGSTTRAWRASVMLDRLDKERTLTDKLDEMIDSIWDSPRDKLEALVRSWVDG